MAKKKPMRKLTEEEYEAYLRRLLRKKNTRHTFAGFSKDEKGDGSVSFPSLLFVLARRVRAAGENGWRAVPLQARAMQR